MQKHVVISGFGVIGIEVLDQLIKKNKKKKLKISIIEKDFSNFPGGIAYSEKNSKYGFFNNFNILLCIEIYEILLAR